MLLAPGVRLARFELLAPLGRGGMGEVWRARDPRLARDVALKFLPLELARFPENVARFEREARALAALSHPNVAQIHEVGEASPDEDGAPLQHYLVMELVEGETVAAALSRGPLPVARAIGVAREVAQALAAAHERGVVHRDLKPANVMLTPEGSAKVLDFGLARVAGRERAGDLDLTDKLSHDGMVVGTAAYMAPEQIRGEECDGACDVWALGSCLGEMLSARKVFAGSTLPDTIANVLAGRVQVEPPASSPRLLQSLMRECFSIERGRRPAMAEVARRLTELESVPAEAPRRLTWRAGVAAAAALALSLGAGTTAWLLLGRRTVVPATGGALRVEVAKVDAAALGAEWAGAEGRLTAALVQALASRGGLATVDRDAQVRIEPALSPAGAALRGEVRLVDAATRAVLGIHLAEMERDDERAGLEALAATAADRAELERLCRELEAEDELLGFLVRRTRSLEAARSFREAAGYHLRVRYADARRGFEAALLADPAFWPAELYLAVIAKSTSDFAAISGRLARVAELAPRPEPQEAAFIEAVTATVGEDFQRAAECLERARQTFPRSGTIAYQTARALIGVGRADRAIPLLNRLIDSGWQPDFSVLRESLALARLEAGDAREALATAGAGEAMFPQRYRFPQLAAFALAELGRGDEAREALARAIRKRVDFSKSDPLAAARDMAYWAQLVRWPEESARQWSRALALSEARIDEGDDGGALEVRAEALVALGRFGEARAMLEPIAAADPYLLLALARARLGVGERDGAREAVQQAGAAWRAGSGPVGGTLAYNVACVWAALGERDEATVWLLRGRDQNGFNRIDIALDPELDPLRAAGLLAPLLAPR